MANLGRTLGLLKPSIDVRRSLSERQWIFAMEVLHEKPDTPERRRLQLLLELGSTTGLRLSELATTRLKGFRRELDSVAHALPAPDRLRRFVARCSRT